MKKIFTLLLIALFAFANAQDIPSFTYQQSHFYPEGPLDGSEGTTFDPANMCCLYQGNYNIGTMDVAAMVIVQGGGSAIVDLYIPPFVNGFSFSVDDPVLAAGNPTIRMALLGEYEVGSTAPTTYNEGDIAEGKWAFVHSANRLFYNDRDPYFATQSSIARIAIYNGLNWGYTTLSDYTDAISLSDIDITWFIAQEDSLDYVAWATGTTAINTVNPQQSEIQIYPNPAQNQITINNGLLVIGRIQILDITGKIVKQVISNNTKQTIDISELNKGIYFVKVGERVRKIVKN